MLLHFVLQQPVQVCSRGFAGFPCRFGLLLVAYYSWPAMKHLGVGLGNFLNFNVGEAIDLLERQRRAFVLEPIGFGQACNVRQERADAGNGFLTA